MGGSASPPSLIGDRAQARTDSLWNGRLRKSHLCGSSTMRWMEPYTGEEPAVSGVSHRGFTRLGLDVSKTRSWLRCWSRCQGRTDSGAPTCATTNCDPDSRTPLWRCSDPRRPGASSSTRTLTPTPTAGTDVAAVTPASRSYVLASLRPLHLDPRGPAACSTATTHRTSASARTNTPNQPPHTNTLTSRSTPLPEPGGRCPADPRTERRGARSASLTEWRRVKWFVRVCGGDGGLGPRLVPGCARAPSPQPGGQGGPGGRTDHQPNRPANLVRPQLWQ
jgi:hypothetical protein